MKIKTLSIISTFGAAATLFAGSLSNAVLADETKAITPAEPTKAERQDTAVKQVSGEQKSYSRKDAYRASTNQIVLHYGEGIESISSLERVLNKRGYPAVALPGGAEGEVELFIGRGKFGKYNQHDLYSGTLGGSAENFYDKHIGGNKDAVPSSGETP